MSKRAVLCVDDEVIVLDSLQEQIQNCIGDGFIVEIAESGLEAMEVFSELIEDGYDVPVVIADYIMPGMTGDTVLEYIYTKNPETRTILLTGHASLQGVENAVNKANLYRFISKPWDKDDLTLTLKAAIKSYKQDITIENQNKELRELNANLEKKVEDRTRQLKELNATKDKFFSIIAHDLKNPFNSLIGFSELLQANAERFSSEDVKEYSGIIFQAAKNGYALLENLLQWSRSQTGSIKFNPDNFNLNELVVGNVRLLNGTAQNKNITLSNEIKENVYVYADKDMLNTVFRNIISNAIKFTQRNGSVTVYTEECNDDFIQIGIKDSGIGISEENIEKLFRIDVNYSTTGTDKETGTGLGLILCKEFVEKNGGTISVSSEIGKGTTFNFTLPLKK